MTATSITAQQGFFHVESPHVIRNLKDRLLRRRAELAEFVASGGCVSFELYSHYVGRMSGLMEAIDMLDELEKLERN